MSQSLVADAVPRKRSGPHHAWWIAFAAGLVFFVNGGLGSYALGVLLPAWVNEFGWPRASISLAYTIGTLFPGLLGVAIGRFTDRFGPRWIIIVGAAISGSSFVMLAGVNSLLFFYVAFIVGALGRCGTSQVPVTAAVARWFVTRRSLAMGLASTGISLAGVILVPLTTWLVIAYGWRTTVIFLGVSIWLLVIPVVWLTMSGTPADRGLEPYGADDPKKDEKKKDAREFTLKRALHHPTFWLIAAAMTLGNAGSNSVGIHALPSIIDKGISPTEGAAAISLMATFALLGKPLFGWLGDRFSSTLLFSFAFVMQACGFIFLMNASPGFGLLGFGVVYGLSLGGTVALQGVVVADHFGTLSYGTIFGALGLPAAITSALSPVIAGLVRDLSGSYSPAFIAFAVSGCFGATCMLTIHLRTRGMRLKRTAAAA